MGPLPAAGGRHPARVGSTRTEYEANEYETNKYEANEYEANDIFGS